MHTKIRSWKTDALSIAGGALLLLALAATAGCAPIANSAAPAQVTPRVYFTNVNDGATVANPVQLTMGAEGFTVEPAGEIKAGAGHLHIMVDTPCVAPGQVITKDEAHLHYGQGQLAAELDLAPGRHTLCLQAADGAHYALAGDGMTHIVTIQVE